MFERFGHVVFHRRRWVLAVAGAAYSVLAPDSFEAQEPAGSWQHGMTALVLGVWCVVGLVVCLRTFRWRRRDDG